MGIERLDIQDFRCFTRVAMTPHSGTNLIIGANGSGKTSLFEVLAILTDHIVRGRSVSEALAYTLTSWDKRDAQRFELDVEGNGGTYRFALEVQHSGQPSSRPFIRSESVTFDGDLLYRFADGQVHLFSEDKAPAVFPFRAEQSFLPNVDHNPYARLAWFKDFVAGIRLLQPNPFAMALASPKDEQAFLNRYGTNFAAFYNYLNAEQPAARTFLEDRLREVLPGFRNLLFRRHGEDKLLLMEFSGERDSVFQLNLLNLSEGQRVLLVLYAAICSLIGNTTVLCVDEPDNFVSLPEIQPWLQVLRDSVTQRNAQAILVSHHPEVIDYLALDAVWRFERPAGPVIARRVEADPSSDLRLSEQIVRGA